MHSTHVVRDIDPARDFVRSAQRQGQSVGLVPTMGALHAGHLKLVQECQQVCDRTVVTIFVNPTQFGPHEDFDQYPRTWDADRAALGTLGVNLLFAPAVETLFSVENTTRVEPPLVAQGLEGVHRPDHFAGVATIVLKLFQILPADFAFFGRKDYQQCLVVRDMVRDLNVPVGIRFCDTVRESDGLALSSRNRYLSPEERQRALGLVQSINHVRGRVEGGECDVRLLESEAIDVLRQAHVDRIDYVAIRDADTLAEIPQVTARAVILIAAHVGKTRLIDNGNLMTLN